VNADQIQFRINPMLTLRTTIAMRKMNTMSARFVARAPNSEFAPADAGASVQN
jgi:hypothetical protein